MSLSARIVLRPSRHLAVCEAVVTIGGLVVAAAACADRWPAWAAAILIVAVVGVLTSLALTPRRSGSIVAVSDRPEVGLTPVGAAAADDGSSWRLAEGTMVWPGFAVVVLARDGGGRRTLPILDRDLHGDDRRALHRFLLWTLRGGAGRRPADT